MQTEISNLKKKNKGLEDRIGEMEPRTDIKCIKYAYTDKGILSHDVHLVNGCGKDLHKINVSINITDTDGKTNSRNIFFGVWSVGESQKVNTPAVNIQKIIITGFCNEGDINSEHIL